MLGRTLQGEKAEAGLHGILGLAKVDYRESMQVDGRTYDDVKDLKDETGVLLGFSADLRFVEHVAFGFEASLLLKPFEFQGSGTQPDGTGNELQLRVRLAGFDRIHFGSN